YPGNGDLDPGKYLDRALGPLLGTGAEQQPDPSVRMEARQSREVRLRALIALRKNNPVDVCRLGNNALKKHVASVFALRRDAVLIAGVHWIPKPHPPPPWPSRCLGVEDIGQRSREDFSTDSLLARFSVPFVRQQPVRFTSDVARRDRASRATVPFPQIVPGGGVAVFALVIDLRAADPRIERGIGPLDIRCLTHIAPPFCALLAI